MVIWKYKLEIKDEQDVAITYPAEILTAQMQDGELCLWAECNPMFRGFKIVKIRIYGTGNPIQGEPGRYISTVQDGGLVWHVYEAQESNPHDHSTGAA